MLVWAVWMVWPMLIPRIISVPLSLPASYMPSAVMERVVHGLVVIHGFVVAAVQESLLVGPSPLPLRP